MRPLSSFALLALLCVWTGFASAAPSARPTLGDKVVAFCQEREGQQVGDGQCAALATEALRAAGAKGRRRDHPAKGDYTWGEQVLLLEAAPDGPRAEGKPADINPGDIIQFRDTKWVSKRRRGTYTMTFKHHTAVIGSVEDGGRTLHIYHQNFGGKKHVMKATLHLDDLKEGWARVYRPVAARR